MLIQILIILFSLFAISRLIRKFRERGVAGKEFYLWLVFWIMVIGATVWFKETDVVAEFLGVEKGADLAVYISVIALFYIIFKLIVKIDKMDRDITKLVRGLALKKDDE